MFQNKMNNHFVILFLSWLDISAATDCALIKGYNQYAYQTSQSSYVQLPGLYSVDEYFDVSFDVFPNPVSTAGAMFSIGSLPNFTYYDPLDRTLRYVVLEFNYDSLRLVTKSRDRFHEEVHLSKAYPEPYVIQDREWHHIHAWRDPLGATDEWYVAIDDITPAEEEVISGKSDVIIKGREAFIGGRPEYTALQFQGIFKNIRLNHMAIPLMGARTNGLVELAKCDSRATRNFMNQILDDYKFWRSRG